MLPNSRGVHVLRIAIVATAFAGSGVFLLRSSPAKRPAVQAAEQGLKVAELEREATAARAALVVRQAAMARAATRPALARAESLRPRVSVERAGWLRVHAAGASAPMEVPVPSLVTERIQADSAAISALTLALTWDTRAAGAQEERVVVEARANAAARLTIRQLERERGPRCGRRCGMVLGAISVVALGIAVDQTRRLW
jgi:hypothetical protein